MVLELEKIEKITHVSHQVNNKFVETYSSVTTTGAALQSHSHATVDVSHLTERFAEGLHWVKTPSDSMQAMHLMNLFMLTIGWILIGYAILIFFQELLETFKFYQERNKKYKEQQLKFWFYFIARIISLNLAAPFFILIMGLSMLSISGLTAIATLVHLAPIFVSLYMLWMIYNLWFNKHAARGQKIAQTIFMLIMILVMIGAASYFGLGLSTALFAAIAVLLITVGAIFYLFDVLERHSFLFTYNNHIHLTFLLEEWSYLSSFLIFISALLTLVIVNFFAPSLLAIVLPSVLIAIGFATLLLIVQPFYDDNPRTEELFLRRVFGCAIGVSLLVAGLLLLTASFVHIAVPLAVAAIFLSIGFGIGWIAKKILNIGSKIPDPENGARKIVNPNLTLLQQVGRYVRAIIGLISMVAATVALLYLFSPSFLIFIVGSIAVGAGVLLFLGLRTLHSYVKKEILKNKRLEQDDSQDLNQNRKLNKKDDLINPAIYSQDSREPINDQDQATIKNQYQAIRFHWSDNATSMLSKISSLQDKFALIDMSINILNNDDNGVKNYKVAKKGIIETLDSIKKTVQTINKKLVEVEKYFEANRKTDQDENSLLENIAIIIQNYDVTQNLIQRVEDACDKFLEPMSKLDIFEKQPADEKVFNLARCIEECKWKFQAINVSVDALRTIAVRYATNIHLDNYNLQI